MNKSLLITLIITCLLPILSNGQGVSITNTNTPADTSAMLDIISTSKGLLLPRMTTAQRNAIASPANSLLIFNTDDQCLQIYINSQWQNIFCDLNCSTAPATPGSITGNASPCENATSVAYSIAQVSGATSYNWTVPAGATITSGQGTTGIVITFGTTNGNISVAASNNCGTSAAQTLAITLQPVPAQPSAITGTSPVCQSDTAVAYSVTNVAGVTYAWTYSGTGFTCVSGCTTNSITADFSASATSGTLTVTPSNACGSGTPQTFAIIVNSVPAAPTANAATNITQTAFDANWTASAGATTYYLDVSTASDFSSFITSYNNNNVGNVTTHTITTTLTCDTTYYYRVRAGNSCGTSVNSNVITVATSDCCGLTADIYGTWRAGAADPGNLANAIDTNDATVTDYGIGGFDTWPCGGCTHSDGRFRYDFQCTKPVGTNVRVKIGHYRSLSFSGDWPVRVTMWSSIDGITWVFEQTLVDDTHSTEHVVDITVTTTNTFRYIGIQPNTSYTENASSVRVYEIEIP